MSHASPLLFILICEQPGRHAWGILMSDAALKDSVCTAQVLNALAPLQQEQGDTSGADSMLKSSFTLSKNLHDLHSQVTTRGLGATCKCPVQIEGCTSTSYTMRKGHQLSLWD